MLTRMLGTAEHVREAETVYGYEYEYGYGAQHGSNKPLQPTRAAGPNDKRGRYVSARAAERRR
jgi:hypothetical protein